jgi:hypothetical protein
MTNIGKPYEGKPHVRFDEEGLGNQPFTLVTSSIVQKIANGII